MASLTQFIQHLHRIGFKLWKSEPFFPKVFERCADVINVGSIDYAVDNRKCKSFYESVRSFLPFIDLTDIVVDSSGMRPKLQGPGEGFRDFIIREESDKGLPGFINLVGIESPGLTASLSIARMVKGIVTDLYAVQKGRTRHSF